MRIHGVDFRVLFGVITIALLSQFSTKTYGIDCTWTAITFNDEIVVGSSPVFMVKNTGSENFPDRSVISWNYDGMNIGWSFSQSSDRFIRTGPDFSRGSTSITKDGLTITLTLSIAPLAESEQGNRLYASNDGCTPEDSSDFFVQAKYCDNSTEIDCIDLSNLIRSNYTLNETTDDAQCSESCGNEPISLVCEEDAAWSVQSGSCARRYTAGYIAGITVSVCGGAALLAFIGIAVAVKLSWSLILLIPAISFAALAVGIGLMFGLEKGDYDMNGGQITGCVIGSIATGALIGSCIYVYLKFTKKS